MRQKSQTLKQNNVNNIVDFLQLFPHNTYQSSFIQQCYEYS